MIIETYNPIRLAIQQLRIIPLLTLSIFAVAADAETPVIELHQNARIAFVGGGLGSRMNVFNEFETELHRRHPELNLYIRNLCKEGDTPAFRPHPSRKEFVVVPGAEMFLREDYVYPVKNRKGRGTGKPESDYPMPDGWLSSHKIDVVVGFFGYSASFEGIERLDAYKEELRAFIRHTKTQRYNGKRAPKIAIVSPAAFEDLSVVRDLPDGSEINEDLAAYAKVMAEVCATEDVRYVDAFSITKALYDQHTDFLTSNGHNLNSFGYRQFSPGLADGLFGIATAKGDYAKTKAAVAEKNRVWLMDYKIPNGVHVHGGRYRPFGPQHVPEELAKTREMTAVRDQAIWAVNKGETFDLAKADAGTRALSPMKTSYKPGNRSQGSIDYKSGQDVTESITVAAGYKVELFADESRFPNLENPCQMAFDNQGRLWVGTMGSYPQHRIGDPLPNDKILILEDTDNDGKADKETIFVDGLHLPIGFEITPEGGCYVSQGNDLVLLHDLDGDGKADGKEVVLSGFDDHDTHHAFGAFCADPSGAIYMAEGFFSFSNVETPYGTVRGNNSGFWRFDPKKCHLERTAQVWTPNPWGIAFNDWGQNFFINTSGPGANWMQPGGVKPRLYGQHNRPGSVLKDGKIRPTSGLEFVSSRHFPDEVQGDLIHGNVITFRGLRQFKITEHVNGGGFDGHVRHDLVSSDHGNFRPVDLEFAPDGSLYFVDWHNALIGHMQHSARDPHRDRVHGRIYRVTYPSRPFVTPPTIAGASIATLLDNLKLPEYRARYRTRRELRGRSAKQVMPQLKAWVAKLDKRDPNYEHHLTEAMWVSWGLNTIDADLVEACITSTNPHARAAAVRAARYNVDKLPKAVDWIKNALGDKNGFVNTEAIVAASWLPREQTIALATHAKSLGNRSWTLKTVIESLENGSTESSGTDDVPVPAYFNKNEAAKASFRRGFTLYNEGENCASCHQANGKGLPAAVPPLVASEWVSKNKELLAKLTLHGVMGPLTIERQKFNAAMPGFAFRTDNKDIADLLTYVANAFGNKSKFYYTEKDVADVLQKTEKSQLGPYDAKDLAKEYKIRQ